MSQDEDSLTNALKRLGSKPEDDDPAPSNKKGFSERLSAAVAMEFAEALRKRGLSGTRPDMPGGDSGLSGAERRMAGGISAKKVDVTYATEESGLILAISIKSINARDGKSGNYQKNLMNRRGDMLIEAVTLHRRFPYAVLVGLFFFDEGAAMDATPRRNSTFENAHRAFRLSSGRNDPAGRDEQYERFYIVLHDAGREAPTVRFYAAGDPKTEISMKSILDEVVEIIGERNPDLYEAKDGHLTRK
jgi:hypothetical protein